MPFGRHCAVQSWSEIGSHSPLNDTPRERRCDGRRVRRTARDHAEDNRYLISAHRGTDSKNFSRSCSVLDLRTRRPSYPLRSPLPPVDYSRPFPKQAYSSSSHLQPVSIVRRNSGHTIFLRLPHQSLPH